MSTIKSDIEKGEPMEPISSLVDSEDALPLSTPPLKQKKAEKSISEHAIYHVDVDHVVPPTPRRRNRNLITPGPEDPIPNLPKSSKLVSDFLKPHQWSRDDWLEKGFVANSIVFIMMCFGILWVVLSPTSIGAGFLLSLGLFGFSGGITNWLAVKMLFDEVPFLYGSGVIPRRFKEIRKAVKDTIMKTFFDEVYLQKYINTKIPAMLENLNIVDRLSKILESDTVDAIIDEKLAELATKPEGMMLQLMGYDPTSLKPMVKPFVVGMGKDLGPLLTKLFDADMINIPKIRKELERLMTTKLQELTPEIVKRLMEDVMRKHLSWLVVWGAVFGSLIGLTFEISSVLWGNFLANATI